MQVRITAVVIRCPFCARLHTADLSTVDAGYFRAPCGRGALWPCVDVSDGAQASGGRHRAKPTRARAVS